MESAVVVFTLTMPKTNSWNARWSNEENLYAVVKNFGRTQEAHDKTESIASKESYHYDFGDGWVARIKAEKMSLKEANKIKKKSNGFCNYEWMIDSIILNGKIISE